MEKEKVNETDAEKIERIEKALADKDNTINEQQKTIYDLNKKLN